MSIHCDSVGIAWLGDGGGGTAAPVPPKAAAFGLPTPLDVTVIAPFRAPSTVGVNVTLIVQEAVGASVAGQALVCAKSPEATMLAMVRVVPPTFCSVTTCAGDVAPTTTLPNPSVGGVSDAVAAGGAAMPVPLSGTALGLLAAFDVTVIAPRGHRVPSV